MFKLEPEEPKEPTRLKTLLCTCEQFFFLPEFFYHVLLDLREICLSDFESLCWTFKHESILLSKQTEQINEKEKPFTQYTHLVSTHKNIKISKTKPKQCRVAGGLSRKEKKSAQKNGTGNPTSAIGWMASYS